MVLDLVLQKMAAPRAAKRHGREVRGLEIVMKCRDSVIKLS
jgi:hypothetical protein